MIETDVLIVGSGPAGSAAALALSTYGIRNVVVTKYRWLADTPRAHITNQRTMEVLRDLGVEDEVNQKRSHQNLMGNNVFCTSLAGEEIGRLYSWGQQPEPHGGLYLVLADRDLRRAAGPDGADPLRQRLRARHAGPVRHGISVPGAGRDRRDRDGARPAVGPRLSNPRQISHRRRRRPLQGRGGHRPPHGRQDGRRRIDEHRLRGGPVGVCREAPERPVLGSAAGCQYRRHRDGAWCAWCGPGTNG